MSRGSVYPYAKNRGVFLGANDPGANSSGLSFAFNGCLIQAPFQPGFNTSMSMTSVENASGMMLLGEESSGGRNGTNDGFFNPSVDGFVEWHMGGTAILFVDTHAKVTKAQDRFRSMLWGNETVPCW